MGIKNLMGSLAKDLFKWWHKQIPGAAAWYASDGDLFLLDKNGIICLLDYKQGKDSITWCEKNLYRDLIVRGIPIYIVKDRLRITGDTEETLKAGAIKIMAQDLSVWSYIPNNSSKGYSSEFISGDFIGWEAELRRKGVIKNMLNYKNDEINTVNVERAKGSI